MSVGEILKVGAIDTVLGMGTVFCILIFIAFCIWLMGKACAPKQATATPAAAPAAAPQTEAAPAEAAYDGFTPETVAIITAAIIQHIADEQGEEAAEGYIVRNVRRAQWKHI
jgi:sodium pump decarboxylase gamma subunit